MHLRWLSLSSLVVAGCLAPEGESESLAANRDDLIGGVAAKPNDFPSTVQIFLGSQACTAAKVGANKFLTAAHCVTEPDGTILRGLASQHVWITTAAKPPWAGQTLIENPDPSKGFAKVHITGAYIDPRWHVAPFWEKGVPDVAVIVISSEHVSTFASVPAATIDDEPVKLGTDVTMMGYGCDVEIGVFKGMPHLKYAFTKTVEGLPTEAHERYLLVPGVSRGGASACNGDSGAPVLRGKTVGKAGRIVGVTAASMGAPVPTETLLTRVGGTWVAKALSNATAPGVFVPIGDAYGAMSCADGGGFVVGAIAAKYRELGGCQSALGRPTDNELTTKDGFGRFSSFEKGSIYWSKNTGAHDVTAAHRDVWEDVGWETGVLGYPTTDTRPTARGVGLYNNFQKGAIYSSPTTGAHEVHGKIFEKWRELGFEAGTLGYPTSNEYAVVEGRRTDFEHGQITWNVATKLAVATTQP